MYDFLKYYGDRLDKAVCNNVYKDYTAYCKKTKVKAMSKAALMVRIKNSGYDTEIVYDKATDTVSKIYNKRKVA